MFFIRHKHTLLAALTVSLLLACQIGPRPTSPPPSPSPPPPFQAQAQPSTPAGTPTVHTPPPPHSPTPSPTHTSTPSPTPALPSSPTSTPSPTPTPELPSAGPLPAVWTELDFGIPVGDAYYPSDLAYDAGSGLAYVLSRCASSSASSGAGDAPPACLSTFDAASDRVLHTAEVPGGYNARRTSSARLSLAGNIVYLYYPWAGDLFKFDGETLAPGEVISGVLAVAFDGQETTYALTREGIMRLAPDPFTRPFTPSDETSGDSPVDMLATTDRVYVLGYETLRVWNAELTLLTTVDVKGCGPRTLALDAGRGRLYVGCSTGLYVLDLETHRLTETPIRMPIDELALDPSGMRLFALARHPADWFGGTDVVSVDVGSAAGTGWITQTLFTTLEGRLSDLILDEERDRLLVASYNDHALIPIDLASGQVEPRLPVGIQLSEVIVDQAGERLYVSDSAGWIHVLDRRTYNAIGHAYGGRHISLDAVHGRLYAGDPRLPVVTVLDAGSLTVRQTIPQSGVPRANPATGEVVVINRRFYVFDGASGKQTGELHPGIGQPPEECPSCYYTIAQGVTIDAQRGLTATTTYTPWPGKPGPRESIAYDPVSGRAYYSLLTGGYVHYSSIATYPDLGKLQERGQPVLYLEGLSGYVQLDSAARRLYVVRGHILFVLDSETLNRVGRVHTDGWSPRIAAVDGELGRLYTPLDDRLVIWTRTGGAPPTLLPHEPAVVTRTVTSILPSPDFAEDRTLLATIDGQLCRSTDGGETWQRLRGGLPELGDYIPTKNAVFSPDYANDRTIFTGAFIGDTHGEGVYRSTDGGETWQLRSDGLYDLRVYQVVPSPAFARDRTLWAYAHTQNLGRMGGIRALYRSTNGGDSWQLVLRQTSHGTPPLPRPEELFSVDEHLPQFECDYQGICQRSDDGGETWASFGTGGVRLGRLVAYALSPQFAQDGTVYFITGADLYRYQEEGQAWSICTLPIFGDRDYAKALSGLATATTGNAAHVLFIGSHDGEFYRFSAHDLPWASISPSPAPSVPTPTPTPCAQDIDARFPQAPARLGCATGPGIETYAAFQLFELGMMFWRKDERRIYVLQQDATWADYEDTWIEDQPDRDPSLMPPEGLYQPLRGFGKVWREHLGGSEAWIGWATAEERGFNAVIQPFAYGLLLKGEDEPIYVLYDDGTWESVRE